MTPTLERFAELYAIRNALDAKLKDIKAQIAILEGSVLEELQMHGINSNNTKFGLVYMSHQLRAERDDNASAEDVCAGLIAAGLGQMVKPGYNTRTVTAHYNAIGKKMQADAGDDVIDPTNQPVAEGLILNEIFSAQVRSARLITPIDITFE